jgi:transcriptional regulator with XRE-family HTH domain
VDAAAIVKRVRALSGVTRKELAELAGLSPSTVGRIEQGVLDPTWGTLSRILEATGHRIYGDTVVSAGDQTAITAARPVLESLLAPASAPASAAKAQPAAGSVVSQWLGRWTRAGWLSDLAGADAAVNVAIAAGNASKVARRNVVRRSVAVPDGWRALVSQLEEEGILYAVSGLIAARPDRATAAAANPMIYVDDPSSAVTMLDLEETVPGRGVLLISPGDDVLTRTEADGGIRFVSRAQGVLDAFAGSGREPDKAESTLRSMLAVSA